jgi:hypothetical protein
MVELFTGRLLKTPHPDAIKRDMGGQRISALSDAVKRSRAVKSLHVRRWSSGALGLTPTAAAEVIGVP